MPDPVEYFNDPLSHYLVSSLHTTEEFYLVSCGNERHSPDWIIKSVIKTGFHLHFILSGKGYLELNHTFYKVERGQIFLLPENVELTYYADRQDPWHYVWVSFGGTKALDFLEKIGIPPQSPVQNCALPPEAFAEIINEMITLHEMTLYNEMKRSSLLFSILALLINARQDTSDKKNNRHDYSPSVYIENAMNYIYLNYDKIKVADISKQLGISQSYLSHIFKEKTGTSLQAFLLNYRLDQAAQLLRNTDYPVHRIAKQVGYDDQFAFSKSFKHVYGVSPNHYRTMPGNSLTE